jgi:hypothetical protein
MRASTPAPRHRALLGAAASHFGPTKRAIGAFQERRAIFFYKTSFKNKELLAGWPGLA